MRAKTQRGSFGKTWWAGRWIAALDRLVDPGRLAKGRSYARSGQKDEAQKVLARLKEEAKSRYVSPYAWALLYTGFGDKKRAIDELDRAYQTGDTNYLVVIKTDPLLDADVGTGPGIGQSLLKTTEPAVEVDSTS